jgi:hypothetical protein
MYTLQYIFSTVFNIRTEQYSTYLVNRCVPHLDGGRANGLEEDPLAGEGLADSHILALLEEFVVLEHRLELVLFHGTLYCTVNQSISPENAFTDINRLIACLTLKQH